MEAQQRPILFTIDRTTPRTTLAISDDGTKAAMTSTDNATFRASQPLTSADHRYAVKIVEDNGKSSHIIIGLLPKLSDAQVAQMDGAMESTGTNECIGSPAIGGWGMSGTGFIEGNWESPPFTFAAGDIVVCDVNFAAKTLTLSCDDRKAVGTIPSIKAGDELYPAVSMYFNGAQVALVAE